MKNIFKRISLFLVAIISVVALASCTLTSAKIIEFVNVPQSTYYKVSSTDTTKVQEAYQTLLSEITIRVKDNANDPGNEYDLKYAIESGIVSAQFDASILTSVGTKTMVITLGSAKLTYVIRVVEEQLFAGGSGTEEDPYLISTPQQFLSITTRFFGIPVPQSNSESAWMYYYKFSFPYLAGDKYYKLVNDLDFSGITYRTMGALGGINYIPFSGTIDGNNKTIKNLSITYVGDYCALFAGLENATIKDLVLYNIDTGLSFAKYTAALASYSMPWRGDAVFTELNQSSNFIERVTIIDNVDIVNSSITGHDRSSSIVVKMTATKVLNCDINLETKVIGTSPTAGVVAQPHSRYFYSYYNRVSDTAIVGSKSAFVNLSDISNCSFSGSIIANATSNHVGKLFGYGAKDNGNNSEPTGFISNGSDDGNAASNKVTYASLMSKNTVVNAILESYVPNGSEIVKYSVSTTGDSSNRTFTLPNDLSSVNPNLKTTYVPFFTKVDGVWTLNSQLTESDVGSQSIIRNNKIFVNNRIELIDIDGNVTGITYYPITKFDNKVTIYIVNNKIMGVNSIGLS